MNLFFKFALLSLAFCLALAEAVYEGDKEVCTSSEFLNKSHLSCIACGLKKAGRPAPDEHFVALMGLLARESTSLFPDEVNPSLKKQGRRSLSSNHSQIVETANGPVELTARAQLQKNVIQMLLSSGYCVQGTINPKVKKVKTGQTESSYSNFIDRMNSDKFAITSDNRKIREKAITEIGYSNWDNAKYEFLMDSTPSFFTLPFEEQKDFYKRRRISAFQRSYDDYRPQNELNTCLNDIDHNYAKNYSSAADSYAACTAIYDECGIATNPNDNNALFRNDSKGNTLRVGGDWCASKFPVPQPAIAKDAKGPINGANDPQKLRADGTSLAPVEDKSSVSLGEVFQRGNLIIGSKATINLDKIIENPDGSILIPREAFKLKQPASLPNIYPQPPEVKIDVRGQQRSSPPPK